MEKTPTGPTRLVVIQTSGEAGELFCSQVGQPVMTGRILIFRMVKADLSRMDNSPAFQRRLAAQMIQVPKGRLKVPDC